MSQPYFDSRSLLSIGVPRHTVAALLSVYERTGGPDDGIAAIETSISALDERIDGLALQTLSSIVTTATNYTINAAGQIVRVTAAATILLPAIPTNGYICAVESQTSGVVTVSGNGNTIQGDTTDSIYVADTLIIYQYFSLITSWVRR